MLRLNQLKRFAPALIGAVFAVVALGAMTASSALAAGGPVWLVEKLELQSPNVEALKSAGGAFVLDGTTNVECNKEVDTGELIGANPGLDLSTIEFLECHVQGTANCLASNVGEDQIDLNVQSVLVYPHEKAETTEQAYDAFFPDNNEETNNLFVEFTLKNASGTTACNLLNNIKVDVNATGSPILKFDNINKKCGVLAEVGLLNSLSEFVLAIAGEEAVNGALNSAGEPELATVWNSTTKAFELLECKLEAFGAAALQLGISDITLNSGLAFGWAI